MLTVQGVKMIGLGLSLLAVSLVSAASSSPNLHVVYAPKSIEFAESQPIRSSNIADFLSVVLGYTLTEPVKWTGLRAITNVLHLPKASLTLEIFDYQQLINVVEDINFPIVDRVGEIDEQFDILARRTYKRFADTRPLLLRVDLANEDLIIPAEGESDLLKSIPENADERLRVTLKDPELAKLVADGVFDPSNADVRLFLLEIGTIKQIIHAISGAGNRDNTRDVLWFQIHGFHQIMQNPNLNSYTKIEAQRLMHSLIQEAINSLRRVYNDKLIVSVIDQPESAIPVIRRRRSLLAARAERAAQPDPKLNLAYHYDVNFHVAFAMIAFTTILIALIVFALAIAMWNLDPGRDSIIYRMTSQRYKKEQ